MHLFFRFISTNLDPLQPACCRKPRALSVCVYLTAYLSVCEINVYLAAGAGLAAYLLGKVSYQGVCRDKILSLEDSPLADAMRKGKRGMELFPEV